MAIAADSKRCCDGPASTTQQTSVTGLADRTRGAHTVAETGMDPDRPPQSSDVGTPDVAHSEEPLYPLDFEAIYREQAVFVWNYLRRMGVAERYREDVMHDVFVTVYRKRDVFDPRRPLRPWLVGIAFRVASDFMRRASIRREIPGAPVDEGALALDSSTSPETLLAQRRRGRLLERALDELSLERRAVIVLHELEGYSVPEVAEILDIPLNTAYSRLRRGRRQLLASVRRLTPPQSAGGEG